MVVCKDFEFVLWKVSYIYNFVKVKYFNYGKIRGCYGYYFYVEVM